jgi:hypothetical protein
MSPFFPQGTLLSIFFGFLDRRDHALRDRLDVVAGQGDDVTGQVDERIDEAACLGRTELLCRGSDYHFFAHLWPDIAERPTVPAIEVQ